MALSVQRGPAQRLRAPGCWSIMPHLAPRFNWRENGGTRGAARIAIMTLVYLAIAFACGILTGYFLRSEAVFSCATWVVQMARY